MPCIHLCAAPCRRHRTPRRSAACALRAASACSNVVGLRDISHPACFHTHRTHPTNKGRQQLDRWRDRRLLRVGTSRSPSQRAGRHGCRQRRPSRCLGSLVLCEARSRRYDMPPSRGVGRFVRPCIGPAGMAAPTPSGPPHRLTFGAGSIERTTRSMSRMGSTGEPTWHVCRHGFANGVSRAPSARFWCGGVNAKHPHDVTCAGAGCRERQCLFCLRVSAASAGRCRKSILRRRPLSRRPPLCGPCGYCLRQTPSVPPIGYREGLRSSATGSGGVERIVGLT